MAQPYIDTTGLTYCGKEAREIFAKDVYDIDLRSYGISMMDNVKSKRKIYLGNMDEAFQAYSCSFTPDGKVKLSEDFIEPVAIKVNKEACFDEFWDNWLVESTSISLDGNIPPEFFDWYFTKLRDEMKKEYQEIFWQGNVDHTGATKGYLAVTNGVQALLNANENVTKIDGANFTVDNILAQVEAAIQKSMEVAAEQDTVTDGYKVFMNHSDIQLLKMALGKLCCGNSMSDRFSNYAKEGERVFIYGVEIVPTMQGRNTIIVGPAKNLVLGFDTFSSSTEYKIIDMRNTTGDNMFRVIALSNIAVGVAWPELFVYSRPE